MPMRCSGYTHTTRCMSCLRRPPPLGAVVSLPLVSSGRTADGLTCLCARAAGAALTLALTAQHGDMGLPVAGSGTSDNQARVALAQAGGRCSCGRAEVGVRLLWRNTAAGVWAEIGGRGGHLAGS